MKLLWAIGSDAGLFMLHSRGLAVDNKKDGYRQRNVRQFLYQPKAHFGLPVRP